MNGRVMLCLMGNRVVKDGLWLDASVECDGATNLEFGVILSCRTLRGDGWVLLETFWAHNITLVVCGSSVLRPTLAGRTLIASH